MSPRSSLPSQEGMLNRLHLKSLIQKGLEYPLLIFLAGPGFGKTQAITSYLGECDAQILWLRMNSFDNLPDHFWNHFTAGLKQEFPKLSRFVETLDFPDTPVKFDAFLHIIQQSIDTEKQVIWVFDDFGEIEDKKVKGFFQMMMELALELKNFHLILLSNKLSAIESFSFKPDSKFIISGEELRFTREEISQLYSMYNVSLETDELRQIERYTDGWALPLHLLALEGKKKPDFFYQDAKLASVGIFGMFEERFFSAYSKEQQKLLLELSLLNFFTKELVIKLYEKESGELDIFTNHVFITKEPSTGYLFFHYIYKCFLQEKKHLLSPDEELNVWRKAADYYKAEGNTNDAITCYRKCSDYIGMLNSICDFARSQYGITAENAEYFLEHLDLLTPDEAAQYPVADYLRSSIYLNMIELEKAENLLLDLERRLLDSSTPEALILLGDVYALLGAVHLMRNQEDFGDYYKKASGYLLEGSNFKSKNKLLTQNIHIFSMPDNQPGAKERMEKAFHYGLFWMTRVLAGGNSGLEYLFSAEAAYLSCELEAAEQHAYRAIYRAESNAQHDLVCNGFCVLARIELMRGNLEEVSRHIQSIVSYAEKYEFTALKEIRDTALAWYYIKMKDFGKIPKAILSINNLDQSLLLSYGRSQIVYANYLITMEEYAKLVGMLEHPKGLYLTRGIWPDRICLFIMLAIGYYYLGNEDASMKALWTAYDMSYHNKLTVLFIEAEKHMTALIDVARRQEKYKFDSSWLELIARGAASFTRRISAVRSFYKKQGTVKVVKENPLTRREEEILLELSRGLSREEIAVKYSISVNTIKSFIKAIYGKLGAGNRAEAVSIAILNNYIEVPLRE